MWIGKIRFEKKVPIYPIITYSLYKKSSISKWFFLGNNKEYKPSSDQRLTKGAGKNKMLKRKQQKILNLLKSLCNLFLPRLKDMLKQEKK